MEREDQERGRDWLHGASGPLVKRIGELLRERDRYHDALIARHGGEPVALLEELDDVRAELQALTKERDMWRNKAKSCAWCRGNLEVGDHTRDCPVYILRGVEEERDELRAEVERLRGDVAKFRAALAGLCSPDNPADMDNREMVTAMMTAIYCLGNIPETKTTLSALALLRDTAFDDGKEATT